MIEARGLTELFGDKVAVHHLTFTARPGVVTGFLGPNGSGKSTTMRMALGLDHPTSGTVTIAGSAIATCLAALGWLAATFGVTHVVWARRDA